MTDVLSPSRRLLIHPWHAIDSVGALDGSRYQWALGTLGFEPRSVAIPEQLAAGGCNGDAIGFNHSKELAYDTNRDVYLRSGWTIPFEDDTEFLPWLKGKVEEFAAPETPVGDRKRPRIAIDVSSMTRTRIAAVIQAITELPAERELTADLLYAPARYSPPRLPPPGFLKREIVSGYFAGSIDSPDLGVMIAGLGYEQHKLGATIEDFGPPRVIAFIPTGDDPAFLRDVKEANKAVLEGPSKPERREYRLADPFGTFQELEALCFDLAHREVPRTSILVPLGPKIFAACCLTAAALHRETVSVWRVSYQDHDRPSAVEPDGPVYGLRLEMPLLSAPS